MEKSYVIKRVKWNVSTTSQTDMIEQQVWSWGKRKNFKYILSTILHLSLLANLFYKR